jgi:hypothetical protein
MDDVASCPSCHIVVRPTDYFCFNCGKNLRPAQPSLSTGTIITLILGSIVLPPMGIIWAIKYLKWPDTNSKIFAVFLIILTIIELIILTQMSIIFINKINDQVNSQMQNIQGL